EIDLLLHLALFFGDARQPLGVLAALGLHGDEIALGAAQRFPCTPEKPGARERQRERQRHRRGELSCLVAREPHRSRRPSTTVKRGASPDSVEPPMSPLSTPSEVTSKGSCVRTSSYPSPTRALAKLCTCPVIPR